MHTGNGTHVASVVFKQKKADLLTLSERLDQLTFCACAEVPDIHMGWEDAAALDETGEFQAGTAQRYTSKCGDCSRAEGRGKRLHPGEQQLSFVLFCCCYCVNIFLPQGKAQRRINAVHIMDALVLNGTDVRDRHFNQR